MQTTNFIERSGLVFDVDDNVSGTSKNAWKMASMMEKQSYLILIAEHDVHDRFHSDGPQCGLRGMAQGLPVKKMRRAFNIVEISCKLLFLYTGMPSLTMPSTFAFRHTPSLICTFSIALMLRAL